MTETTSAPDIAQFPIPRNQWTQPFWDATARGELELPRCGSCGAWRWPPGPFCPECRSQDVEWSPSGPAVLYSYTVVRQPVADGETRVIAPGLVEFPRAGGVRIVAAIVDTPVDAIAIGSELTLGWNRKDEDNVPVFSIGGTGD
jgi:uncharacterized OB-fold protein